MSKAIVADFASKSLVGWNRNSRGGGGVALGFRQGAGNKCRLYRSAWTAPISQEYKCKRGQPLPNRRASKAPFTLAIDADRGCLKSTREINGVQLGRVEGGSKLHFESPPRAALGTVFHAWNSVVVI